ncbi:MAG: radical SAM protein [Deltaproteobacteria bacterium]|nr:radical SAM protein [Deltaproteobacteria bacterium]
MKLLNYLKEETIINTKNLAYILFKRKDIKSFKNYIMARATVANVGPGFPHAIYRKFPSLVPYPREIEVEITTRCHLKCTHCEHTYWSDEHNRDLTFEEYKHILSQFPNLWWINTTGEGSSFLNKDFVRMLEYTKSKGIFIKFVESFTNLTEEQMETIIKVGVERLYVSMEGATAETYEKIRIGASFNKVIENLKTFRELKKKLRSPLPEVSYRYVVMKENYHELPDFVRLIKSLDLGNTINVVGTLDFDEIKHLSIKERQEHIEELLRIADDLDMDTPIGDTITQPPITRCTCWVQPYIMIGGYIMPCCGVMMANRRTFLRENALGNIFEAPFKEIWNSPRYKALREGMTKSKGPLDPMCVGCRSFDTLGRR